MIRTATRCLSLALFLAVAPIPRGVEAGVFGNGDLTNTATTANGVAFGFHDGYALFTQSSTSTAAARNLTGAWVLLGDNTTVSAFTVSIWTGNSINGPNTQVATSSSISLPALGSSTFAWQFAPFTYSASGLTEYFIVVKRTAPANFHWGTPNLNQTYSTLGFSGSLWNTSPSVAFFGTTNNGSTWSQFNSNTVGSTPVGVQLVPEPSTYALLASGLCAAAVAAGRRRVRNSAQQKPASETATLLGDMAAR